MGFEFKTEEERNPQVEIISEDDLTQNVLTPEQEGQLALEYLMEVGDYQKFLIWQEIKKTAGF